MQALSSSQSKFPSNSEMSFPELFLLDVLSKRESYLFVMFLRVARMLKFLFMSRMPSDLFKTSWQEEDVRGKDPIAFPSCILQMCLRMETEEENRKR